MNEKTAQWVTVVVGVALIAIYSAVMISTEGTSGWSWILLVAGIGSLVGGVRLFRRSAEP
jgi:predicted phage tail protein